MYSSTSRGSHPPLHPMLCCSSQYGDMLHDTERVSPGLQGRGGAVCWGAWHTGHVLPVHWMCGYRAVEHR